MYIKKINFIKNIKNYNEQKNKAYLSSKLTDPLVTWERRVKIVEKLSKFRN
jgi:hypothetical protein